MTAGPAQLSSTGDFVSHPATDLAQIVDTNFSDAKVSKFGHGLADLLTLPHPDYPDTQRDAASEGFEDIGEGQSRERR